MFFKYNILDEFGHCLVFVCLMAVAALIILHISIFTCSCHCFMINGRVMSDLECVTSFRIAESTALEIGVGTVVGCIGCRIDLAFTELRISVSAELLSPDRSVISSFIDATSL
ncbi:MAG: hypothetical protein ACI3YL_05485 [Prevotella sp.]